MFGFVAGALGAAYNTNRPFIVIYASLRHWPPEEFRATLQGFFFAAGRPILTGHCAMGRRTTTIVTADTEPETALAIASALRYSLLCQFKERPK
jgi:hypothetical protein